MSGLIFNLLLTCLTFEPSLSHIEQLTTHEMGFQRAGEAYFSPDSTMVSFQAVPFGEEDYHIYTMNLETREVVKVSGDAEACTCSYFRPDGQKILFAASPEKAPKPVPGSYKWDLTSYMNIYEANLDGSDAVALTHGPAYHAECAYSPDGSKIVYASNEDGSMNIYVMDRDGTNVQQLTHTTHCYNGGPFFSPDGQKIVFRADREAPHLLQVYVIDVDGNNLMQLTNNGAVNWAPYWHPSGEAIAYTSSQQGHHNYQIYWLDINSGRVVSITSTAGFNGLPSFNREGTKMLWTSKRGDERTSQVFIADFNPPFLKEES
ncbi:MAG: TolB family protein [Parachlamydiaceae bacterium]